MATMIETKTEGTLLVISLSGRIDSSTAAEASERIRSVINANPGIPWVLDAEDLDYISSAGLRILLSLSKETPDRVCIRNVSPLVYDTLSMTGFTEILDVKKQLRSISVEGCPVIGSGAVGIVYRLDEDTIVKVYKIPDCLSMIETEQKRAKQAFVRGIPTAISYDIVRVGDKYGSVFEMVKAENCNDRIIRDPEHRDELIRLYVKLLKTVHNVEMPAGELPKSCDLYLGYLDAVAGYLPENTVVRIRQLLQSMPDSVHAVHGDFQMKNVMLSESEPLLIDMETLSVGDPVFDFAGLFVAYCAFNIADPTNSMDFFGIDKETSFEIYHKTLSLYLGDVSEAEVQKAEEKIEVLGFLRFLYLLTSLHLGKPEIYEFRMQYIRENLERLLEHVDQLCL
ncbi:MAG: anti-sigma factor antagonist [Clostridia bacterium]|nr:anti-sigma factor antagonist [Clostridia bacterium]